MLADRTAIITGAGSGIGEATARLFAEHGARVLAVDLPGRGLSDVFPSGGPIVAFEMDITDPGAPAAIIAAALDRWAGVDILFNNAGVGARVPGETERRAMIDTPDDHWDWIIDVNLSAQFRLTKAVAPVLRESAAGRLIFNGSPLAHRPDWGISSYTASKGAVAGFARAVALEEGVYGTTSNWVEPGAIVTGMTAEGYVGTENGKVWAAKSPFNRLGAPLDIARGVLFLASDLAAFVTGQGLCIDGGITIKL